MKKINENDIIMKKALLFVVAFFLTTALFAENVNQSKAKQVARNFAAQCERNTAQLKLNVVYSHPMPEKRDAALYVVNLGESGFVIVSANDAAHPVLGYSLDRPWPTDGNIAPQVAAYLDDLAAQIEFASEQEPDRGTQSEWQKLLLGNPNNLIDPKGNRTQVGPLMTTTWNQTEYYNAMCPEDPESQYGGRVVTGCVATAIAQIINYWGYPEHGRGSHAYNVSVLDPGSMPSSMNLTGYGTQYVNFEEATYDYNHMPDALTSTSSQQQVDAVAQLMYHCGVAVNMFYGTDGSGAYSEDVSSALISYFGFTPTLGLTDRRLYNNTEWNDSLRANVDRGEPVYYAATNPWGNHAFVMDGYNQDDYFHFNFGWGGNYDGWYLTTAINAAYEYNQWQEAVMGIRPDSDAHAIICHRKMGVQNLDNFIVSDPVNLYPLRGCSNYKQPNEMSGVRINLNLVPEDESGQLVLDVLQFDNEQSVVIYDGPNKDSLVRVIETRNLDDYTTVTYHTWVYEGGSGDAVFQEMACTDFSPIVSTRHGFTVVAYSYGGIPETFHLRVSDAADCRMVSNLTAEKNDDGVLVTWTENGDATQWQVMVGEETYNCNETQILLTTLLPEETYEVKVRAVCDEQNYSSWNSIIVNKRVYWTDVVKSEPDGYVLDGNTIRITSAEGLAWVAHCIDSLYLNGSDWQVYQYDHRDISIEGDINLEGYYWNPIRMWFGKVDGHGHIIDNMNVNTSGSGGFIESVHNAEIHDLRFTNARVNAVNNAGTIVGYISNSSVNNCSSENHIISTQNSVGGGLFGYVRDGSKLQNCYAYGNVYAQFGYGGLVGYANNSEFANCVVQSGQHFNWPGLLASGVAHGIVTKEVHGGRFYNCFPEISNTKWYGAPETFTEYFLGEVYNVDAMENMVAFNVTTNPSGMLIADTAINYTLGENMDVITALNDYVTELNSADFRTWVVDSETHLPTFGDYFEVTCPNVSNLTASNVPYNGGFAVALSWHENGDAEQWQVKYKIQNAPDNTAVVLNTNTNINTIEGLQLGNMYEFYVRPICGDEPTVGWGQPLTFYVDKTLWIDMVTSCPEGYVEDSNGNVTISSAEGLAWLAKIGFDYRENTVYIANDIDMGAYKWTPIGKYEFRGVVEGNNHTISNIYCNDDLTDNNSRGSGLIGHAINASFKNLIILNSSFVGNRYVGSVAGYAENCKVYNCHAKNVIVKGKQTVGGLCGCCFSSLSEIYNSSSSGSVYSDLDEGGLVGSSSATVINCYTSCDVKPFGYSSRWYYGGLFGSAGGTIKNCYSSGNIEHGDNDNGFLVAGSFVGQTSNITADHIYVPLFDNYPFVGRSYEELVLSDTASFINNALLNPVTIADTEYTDLLSALNAWVDANNTNGQYLHWIADTEGVNGGFPVFIRSGNIDFADANVKAICVANWDTNGDGELSYAEAAAVTDLGEVFKMNYTITTFDELQYFTGLTVIGDNAFAHCLNLTSVVLPNTVTELGWQAFYDCRSLLSITIPASVNYIVGGALNCGNLEMIVVEEGNEVYDSRENCNAVIVTESNMLFRGCKNTIIPNSVVTIGENAFSSCTIESVYIPASITSIHHTSFYDCEFLSEITVSESNPVYDSRNNCNAIIETSTNKLIAGSKITVIPNTVTSIDNQAFSYRYRSGSYNITIPELVTSIGYDAFLGGYAIESVTVLAEVPPTLGNNAFCNVPKDIPVYVPCGTRSAYQAAEGWSEFTNYQTAGDCPIIFADANVKAICVANWDTNGDGELSYAEAAAVTNLGDVFKFNTTILSFDELQYFTGLTEISSFTFYSCNNLASIVIPENVTSIGSHAFYDCYSLTDIEIPEAVASIGYEAFGSCKMLEQIIVNEGNTVYDSRNNCNAIIETNTNKLIAGCKNTVIPNTVTSIGDYAFVYCANLASIEIPTSVTEIGMDAFNGCSSLTSIVISNTVTSIGVRAFASCASVEQITVDENNTVYDSRNDCNAIIETGTNTIISGCKNTVIPESITIIGHSAFWGCYDLVSIDIPDSVTMICDYAFNSCSNLVSIDIPDSVTTIGSDAFASCYALASVKIGAAVTSIGSYSFGWCISLAVLKIYAETPPTLDPNAFYYLTNNIVINVPCGTKSDYQAAEGWSEFTNYQEFGCAGGDYHWDVNIYQYADNMSMCGIIQIDGVEQATDALELGAFNGDECRGRERLVYAPIANRYILFLTVFGEEGDEITFRLYDHQTEEEVELPCTTVLTFVINDVIGTVFEPWIFNFANQTVEQTQDLSVGWNWYSIYIELSDIDGLSMLEEAIGDNGYSINSQTAFTKYYGQENGWYGSLTSINNESMYRLRMNNAATITMVGSIADPTQHPITLVPGWSHIGFISSSSMSADEALSGLDATVGDLVKTQKAYTKYYGAENGWYGSLSTIKPGDGLMYKSVADQSKTFTYPSNPTRSSLTPVATDAKHWTNDAHAHPSNMTMLAVVEIDGKELNTDDYELAAFAEDGCRGSIRLMYVEPIDRHVAFLTVAGDEAKELHFALYNTTTGESFLDAEERMTFESDAALGTFEDPFVLHFRQTTGVDEATVNALVYPNPTDGGVTVEACGMRHITVTNAIGQVVMDADINGDVFHFDMGDCRSGIYMLRVNTTNGMVVKKVSVTKK